MHIYATVEGLLQSGQLLMLYFDQLSFYKLFSHILALEPDTKDLPAVHELVNASRNQSNAFVNFKEDKDKKDLHITSPEKYISCYTFEEINDTKPALK